MLQYQINRYKPHLRFFMVLDLGLDASDATQKKTLTKKNWIFGFFYIYFVLKRLSKKKDNITIIFLCLEY